MKLILTNYSLGYEAPNSYFGADYNQPLYSLGYGAPNSHFEAENNQTLYSLGYRALNSYSGAVLTNRSIWSSIYYLKDDTNQLFSRLCRPPPQLLF